MPENTTESSEQKLKARYMPENTDAHPKGQKERRAALAETLMKLYDMHGHKPFTTENLDDPLNSRKEEPLKGRSFLQRLFHGGWLSRSNLMNLQDRES